MIKKTYQIHIKSLLSKVSFNVKPLTANDLQELMTLARETGWYGNNELLKFVIERGFTDADVAAQLVHKVDVFIFYNTVREIWILTLRELAKEVNKLLSLIEENPSKITVKRYKYTDLATPGLLWNIQHKIQYIDTESFAYDLLNELISGVRIGGKILSSEESKDLLVQHFDEITTWYLGANGVDGNYIEELPSQLFKNNREKFYVILQLARTIDWRQYYEILFLYNKALEKLVFKSNQMGGLSTKEPVLLTGIAAFINMARPPEVIELKVLGALAEDIVTNRIKNLSKHYIKLVKKYFKESLKEIRNQYSSNISPEDLAYELLNCLALKMNRNKCLLIKICFAYWDDYSECLKQNILEALKKFKEELEMLIIPDCYLLVEGESDKICYSKFIQIVKKSNVFIKVLDCGGKGGVLDKYIDIIRNEHYIGSIVTVLDSDANQEFEDIKRLPKDEVIASHYKYDNGSLEDLFTNEMIADAVNALFPEGVEVTTMDLSGQGRMENIIKREVWEKKKASFGKIEFAKEISSRIETKDRIPNFALEIIEKSIELAEQRAKDKPKAHSFLSIQSIDYTKRLQELSEILGK